MPDELTAVFVALAVAGLWGVVAVRLGPAWGWVDAPDDGALKAHSRPAVPLGGVGLFLAVNLAMAATGIFDINLVVVSAVLVLLGLVDDRGGVPPLIRLGVEAVAGFALGISAVGESLVGAALIAVLVVVAINSVNLLDGLDGLAGLSGCVAAAGVAALAMARGTNPVFGLALVGAAAGFLLWNWHPARMFLGDNGAYVLAVFLVYGMVQASNGVGDLLIAAAMFGVFFFDLAATLLRRAISHQPIFSRDRLHLYDRLIDRGVSVPGVALMAGALEALYVAAVVVADEVLSTPVAIITLLVIAAATIVFLVKALGATEPGEWQSQ